MKNYRVAILGCRGRGSAAARAYHAHPRTELVGLCDLIEERLNTLGDEVNVSAPIHRPRRDDKPTYARHCRHSDRHRISLRSVYARTRARRSHRSRKNRCA